MKYLPWLLLLLLGAGAFLLWPAEPPLAAPAAATDAAAAAAPPATSSAAIERERSSAATSQQATGESNTGDAAAPDLAQPPVAAAARIELRVYDRSTQQALPTFRCRWRGAGQSQWLDGSDGRALLRGDLPTAIELLVEAPGYLPQQSDGIAVPVVGAPLLVLDFFLQAAAVATGIQLQLRTVANEPVTHAQFAAYSLPAAADDELDFTLLPPLWVRRNTNADGRYQLPELPPGSYGIRALALDADGELLPLLPHLGRYTLHGGNGYQEEIALEPGCLLQLECVDARGQPVDPTAIPLLLSLQLPGGPPQAQVFAGRDANGKLVAARDAWPVAGPCWLVTAIAAGNWELSWQQPPGVAQRRLLTLPAGAVHRERLTLP